MTPGPAPPTMVQPCSAQRLPPDPPWSLPPGSTRGACSPTADVSVTSPGPASCLASSRHRPSPPRARTTMRPCSLSPVRAAAGAWSSSTPSRQATDPSTDPDPIHRYSGSTTHDAVTAERRPKRHPPFPLDHRRQRPNSVRCLPSAPTRTAQPTSRPFAPIPIPILAANPTASNPALRSPRSRTRHQIPIGPADRLSGLSRSDFLPWRFSDAGRRSACTVVMPASEKPAQKR